MEWIAKTNRPNCNNKGAGITLNWRYGRSIYLFYSWFWYYCFDCLRGILLTWLEEPLFNDGAQLFTIWDHIRELTRRAHPQPRYLTWARVQPGRIVLSGTTPFWLQPLGKKSTAPFCGLPGDFCYRERVQLINSNATTTNKELAGPGLALLALRAAISKSCEGPATYAWGLWKG